MSSGTLGKSREEPGLAAPVGGQETGQQPSVRSEREGTDPESTEEGEMQAQYQCSDSWQLVRAVGGGTFYRPTHGEYTLAPEWREHALQQLGVHPQEVRLDLFASKERAARPLFVTKGMDAFTYDWALLSEREAETLWANPPFYLLAKVVGKIWQERIRIVLCHPEWQEAPWWGPLLTLVKAGVTLPEGLSLYYGVIKKDILPPPKWRTCVSLIESKGDRGPYPDPKVAEWLDQRNLLRDRHFLRRQVEASGGQGEAEPQDPGGTGRPPRPSGAGEPLGEKLEEGGGTPSEKKKVRTRVTWTPRWKTQRPFPGWESKSLGASGRPSVHVKCT